MDIRIINNRSLWNTFVNQQPDASRLHTFEWSEAQHLLGKITYRLGAFENEKLVGIMLLIVANLPISIMDLKYIDSPSHSNATGGNADVLAALVAEAHMIARREHAIMLRLQPNLPAHGSQLVPWLNSTKPHGVTISTTCSEDSYYPTYDYIYRSPLYNIWALATRVNQHHPARPMQPQTIPVQSNNARTMPMRVR